VAGDGADALRIAGESRSDLMVLDLMLPGMDGLEVMRRLREHERVSVILLTAKGEHTDRIIGLRLGADGYVVKPFSPAELVARVDAVLRRGRTVEVEVADTGLGLTICRAIVEAHGGEIWFADSAAGTRVRFSLPRAA
jgi:two-component system, OmpR family, response regulator ResD